MRRRAFPALASLALLGLASCESRPASGGGGGLDPTTGAHTIHLTGTTAEPIGCGQCHDGTFQVTLQGSLASANGAQPAFNGGAQTCSNVYCHSGGPGLLLGGGTLPVPVWNPPSIGSCGACHASPGGPIDTSAWHPAVAAGVQCALCHPGFTNASVNRSVHVNAVVDLTRPSMSTDCTACHGDASRVLPPGTPVEVQFAPPVDRDGSSATSLVGVGAHQSHLVPGPGAIASPIACDECHVLPTDLLHVGPLRTTPASLNWGPLASTGSATPTFDRASATCANYCHGQTLRGGGSITRPVWTKVDGTQAACGTCHGSPPSDTAHYLHASGAILSLACGFCHPPDYSNGSIGPAAVPIHVNGARDMNGVNFPDWNPAASNPGGWTGTAVGCHGGTRYWAEGVPSTGGCY